MLARLQQLIALSLGALALAAFVYGARSGRPWLGGAVLAVFVLGYLAVLGVEFWLLRRSYAPSDPERPRATQLVHAWWTEALVAPRVFRGQQPVRSASEPDHLPATAHGRRGVLFVHGFFCNRGLWNPCLRRLRAAGVPFVAVDLEPIFGAIDDYRQRIGAAAARLEGATGLSPAVVAHSMGGLAVRAWLRAEPDVRLHRLVTIATPHAGTRLARESRGRGNIAQMRPQSAWLEALARDDAVTSRTDVICFWSRCDNIVFPTRSATLAGADNRELDGMPHVAMAFHPAVLDEIVRALASPPAPGA
jgi:pimeloyl-ACP methyl ester carboxylesterase